MPPGPASSHTGAQDTERALRYPLFARAVIRISRIGVVYAALGLAVACSPAEIPTGINDPAEASNRKVHAFNRGLDRALIRPASNAYGSVLPQPVRTGVGNLSDNLSLPGNVANDILQGEVEDAVHNSFRFAINMLFGFGLFDPAGSSFGLPERSSDFGQTLHVWGVGEGAYVELPFYGPSTARDAVGVVVNLFSNPINFSPTRPVDNIGVYAEVVRRMGDRGRFSDTVDSILYESADSYAQARTIYLQNRRFELARDDEDAYLGLYTDPYAETGTDPVRDPYLDPYEDPYAE